MDDKPHGFPLQDVGTSVELAGLSYEIDQHRILNELSFRSDVPRIGIIGRNGSGKSTLARVLAGLVAPTNGYCHLNGVDVSKDRKAALREVGILFQNPDHQIIFPTVLEELSFGLRQQKQSQQSAETVAVKVLESFGKAHWKDVAIYTLSQGQKHLVCLMAIVAMAPRILILDEPFAGLDLPTRLQLVRYLSLYQGTLVHISHEPDDLKTYDEILWLDRGTLRDRGTPQTILAAYHDEMIWLGGEDDISDIPG